MLLDPSDSFLPYGEWGFDEALGRGALEYDDEGIGLAEQVYEFRRRTRELTPSEQAELLGAVVEYGGRGRGRGRSGGGFDFTRFTRGIQQGLGAFQAGAQIVGGLAGAFGGNNRTARSFSRWATRLGQGAGQIGGMMQALRGRQVPAIRGGVSPGAGGRRPSPRQIRRPAGGRPAVRGRAGAPGGGQLNATALLGLLTSNPQLMQALRSAPLLRRAGARRVEVDIPNSGPVSIPLGEVMNAFAHLARASMHELNGLASEDDAEIPEYLLGDDGEPLVDPANEEERAALALHLLRLDGEADRYAELNDLVASDGYFEGDLDESELWAREAGFDD